MKRLITLLFLAPLLAGCLAPEPEKPVLVEPEPAPAADISGFLG